MFGQGAPRQDRRFAGSLRVCGGREVQRLDHRPGCGGYRFGSSFAQALDLDLGEQASRDELILDESDSVLDRAVRGRDQRPPLGAPGSDDGDLDPVPELLEDRGAPGGALAEHRTVRDDEERLPGARRVLGPPYMGGLRHESFDLGQAYGVGQVKRHEAWRSKLRATG